MFMNEFSLACYGSGEIWAACAMAFVLGFVMHRALSRMMKMDFSKGTR